MPCGTPRHQVRAAPTEARHDLATQSAARNKMAAVVEPQSVNEQAGLAEAPTATVSVNEQAGLAEAPTATVVEAPTASSAPETPTNGAEDATPASAVPPVVFTPNPVPAASSTKKKGKPRKPTKTWEEWENLVVLRIWKRFYLKLKNEVTNNDVVRRDMIKDIEAEGVEKGTPSNLKNKLESMQKWYPKIQDKLRQSGIELAESETPYLAKMNAERWALLHELFCKNPCTGPIGGGVSVGAVEEVAFEKATSSGKRKRKPAVDEEGGASEEVEDPYAGKKTEKKLKRQAERNKMQSPTDLNILANAMARDGARTERMELLRMKFEARMKGIDISDLIAEFQNDSTSTAVQDV